MSLPPATNAYLARRAQLTTTLANNDECARAVLAIYSDTLRGCRNERRAFDDAVRAWRQRYPNASPEEAPPAVASIICHKI